MSESANSGRLAVMRIGVYLLGLATIFAGILNAGDLYDSQNITQRAIRKVTAIPMIDWDTSMDK
jgi:hypothetical protein